MARLAPITPTTVGSYPRPATLVEPIPGERASNIRFTTEGDALREAQDEAVIAVIRDQEEAGLELIGDGEQRRTNFINHILASWDGFDFENRAMKTIEAEFGERDRLAFAQSAQLGRPATEVAAGLGVSVNQVYQAKSRILRRLAELVAAQIEEEE